MLPLTLLFCVLVFFGLSLQQELDCFEKSDQQLSDEIDQYDHRLGLVLHSIQLRLWSLETGSDKFEHQQENFEPVFQFYREYVPWAMRRFRQYCLPRIMAQSKQQEPALSSVSIRSIDCIQTLLNFSHLMNNNCRYWEGAIVEYQRFVPEIDQDLIYKPITNEQNAEDNQQNLNSTGLPSSEKNKTMEHEMLDLTISPQEMKINHNGNEINCEESLEHWMMKLDDPKELEQIWNQCHRKLASESINNKFLMVLNEVSGPHFTHIWAVWNRDLGLEQPKHVLLKAKVLWNQVKPFYRLLFSYIHHGLHEHYGPKDRPEYRNLSTIPLHWLRSLTGTRLNTIIDLLKPYKDLPDEDDGSKFQKSSAVQNVVEFYLKAGFPSLPEKFWQRSRVVSNANCHPVSVDMVIEDDVRMSICLTNDTDYDMRRLFHEMGHVYYYLHSRNRKNLYKTEHNSAAQESIGEVIRLLWNGCQANKFAINYQSNPLLIHKYRINSLMAEALSSFSIIPYGLHLEMWRHHTFTSGRNKTIEQLNDDYWQIRKNIQGISRPLSDDNPLPSLDPLMKFHISHFVPYLRYYFGTILIHQFHEKICTGNNRNLGTFLVECCPSDRSDLYYFRKFLSINLFDKLNRSEQDLSILRRIFDNDNGQLVYRMNSLLNYYQPLIEWLKQWQRNSRGPNRTAKQIEV